MSVQVDFKASLGFELYSKSRWVYDDATLIATDIGNIVFASSASPIVITVPSTSIIPIGSRPITIVRMGSGEVSLSTAYTLHPSTVSIYPRYYGLDLMAIAQDEYIALDRSGVVSDSQVFWVGSA